MKGSDEALSSQTLKELSDQLGVQLEEEEAGRLWNTLNELANDPSEYATFMANQLQHLDSSKDGEVVLNEQSAATAMPPFVPMHGFVVKTFTSPDETKLFVNICHHATVPKPVNEHSIPLLVSKVRDCVDGSHNKAIAVDVVVHSWCIDTCKREASFKEGLVNLAISSLKEEHSITVEARGRMPWNIIKSKYKGGLGKDGTIPRPFEDKQQGKKKEPVAESPSDLLKFRETQRLETQHEEALKMPQPDETKKKPATLIEEISSSHQSANTSSNATSNYKPSKSSKGPAIKAGFLNQRRSGKPLYPEGGSSGDGSTGTGGSYASLMSKCKVVDTQYHHSSNDANHSKDIDQTLKDLSNVMAGMMAASDVEEEVTPTDAITTKSDKNAAKSERSGSNDVAITTIDGRMTLQVDLSSCSPKVSGMAGLELQMSEMSFDLVATKCNRRWNACFPDPIDVGSVSAKFRRKQQTLEVVCRQK